MRRLLAALLLVGVVGLLSGCEVANGGIENASSKIAKGILPVVEGICGRDDKERRGGVRNIMLMDGREDDGIVTCNDGTNHYFDA